MESTRSDDMSWFIRRLTGMMVQVSQGEVMISQGRIEDFTFGHQDQADDVDWIVDKLVTIINAANLMDSSDDEADACRTARA